VWTVSGGYCDNVKSPDHAGTPEGLAYGLIAHKPLHGAMLISQARQVLHAHA
jgi:hypothetical protein